MSKQKSKEEVKTLLEKLGQQLFDVENYYFIYSELGLHYNKAVNKESSEAYLEIVNAHKGFFIPVQNALRSTLTNELFSFINSKDEVSLRNAIEYFKLIDGAPDLTSNYNKLKSKNTHIMDHIDDFRNKYYAHKSGKDLTKLKTSNDKEFQELFADIKKLLNQANEFYGNVNWYFERDSSEAVKDTHDMMNNLLRGESQRLNEINIKYISDVFEDGRKKWLKGEV